MGISATRTNGGTRRPSKGAFAGLSALLALTLLMALPSVSWAQNPSLDQYVESVPTSDGDRAPQGDPDRDRDGGRSNGGSGNGGDGSATLPPQTREQIQEQGGADAAALEAVATRPGLGAPASDGDGGRSSGKGGDRDQAGGGSSGTGSGGTGSTADAGSPGAVDAVTTAATGSGGDAGPWLLLALVALTAAAGALALARRRSQSH